MESTYAGQIAFLVRRLVALTGLPQTVCETLHHCMFELVGMVKTPSQGIVQGTNSRRSIAGDLLNDRDVHGHVEEGIAVLAFGGELASERIGLGKNSMIFWMRVDDHGDGLLQRFHRRGRTTLSPHVDEYLAKLIPLLTENHWQRSNC